MRKNRFSEERMVPMRDARRHIGYPALPRSAKSASKPSTLGANTSVSERISQAPH